MGKQGGKSQEDTVPRCLDWEGFEALALQLCETNTSDLERNVLH